jgi:NAD(P)H-flavin reductase
MNPEKHSVFCELIYNTSISDELFRLDFVWQADKQAGQPKFTPPKAGQFFMIKPKRSSVFLGRPISLTNWQPASDDPEFIRRRARSKRSPYQRYLTGKYLESDTVSFLIALRGRGTRELAVMRSGEEAELTGPLGNAWVDFLPRGKKTNGKPIALVAGGIGLAPLNALLCENSGHSFVLHAGFKKGLGKNEKSELLGPAFLGSENIILASENGKTGHKGLITDFLEPEKYSAVCACGPQPMMKAAAQKCKAAGVPCFVSMERRMACGVGACLGCTVKTVRGNRRCCADGPVFNAEEVIFDE